MDLRIQNQIQANCHNSTYLHVVAESQELALHLVVEVAVELLYLRLGGAGVDVLGINDLLDYGGKSGLDVGVGELGIGGRVGDCLLAQIVEVDDGGKHTNGLEKGASVVVLGESVLGKEILADEFSNLHDDLLILGKGLLTDELDNLGEVILLLEDGTALVTEVGVTGVHVVEEGLEDVHVLGVGDEPVDGGEVLTLGKFFVKTPEHLNNGQSGGRNRIGEITTGRRDGTDDGHGTLTLGRTEAGNAAGTLVKGSKTGTEVGGVTGIGRHLSETAGNLTKGLGPTGGGVSHHRNVHALITEVLRKGNTGVDGGLTGSDRHVGGVGNEGSTLHDTNLAVLAGISIGNGHGKLGEIAKNLRHFVTTLTATDVNNGVGVGELGKRLRDDGLATSEGTRDGAGTAKNGGEKAINDAKAGDEGLVAGELLLDGTGTTDGPEVAESEVVGLVLGLVVDLHDNVVNEERLLAIGAGGVELGNDTVDIGRAQNLVGANKLVLVNNANDITAGDGLSLTEVAGGEGPPLGAGQTGHIHTLGDVDVAGVLEDVLQRTLNTIEDSVHDAGSELYGQRLLLAEDGVADGETGGILVNLDRSRVTLELNDLADQLGVADTNKLVHGRTGHAIGDDQRSGDLEDEAVIGLLLVRSVRSHDEVMKVSGGN